MKPSVQIIAEEGTAAFNALGEELRHRRKLGNGLHAAIAFLNGLSPIHVSLMAQLVRAEVGLYETRRGQPFWEKWLAPIGHREQLNRTQKLEFIFLFHSDGRLREAALDKIRGGLESPFWVAALMFRMNDWAGPVRRAASRCIQRVMPLTSPDIAARAIFSLLPWQRSWQRWGDAEQTLFRAVCARSDIRAKLVELITTQTIGPVPTALRAALQTSLLDDCLTDIASRAKNPRIRSIATEALLDGAATWRSGYTWQWIDKRYNLRRPIPVFSHRPLSCVISPLAVAEKAIADRSPIVRRASLLCADRGSLPADIALLCVQKLARDPVKKVRDLAAFLLRKMSA